MTFRIGRILEIERALDRTVKNWLRKRMWTVVMYEPLSVHSNTYFYVLLVKTFYRPQCICFLRSLEKKAPILAHSSKRVEPVPGNTASMLYETGRKLMRRHLQT
jgi:hypothetical protein